ncbi:Uncharacterised protein [Mycobacterium tuberculosis]|nr:Uncharacterised protein [Mycobacterium tuberculosis]
MLTRGEVRALPADAVVLSADDAADLSDRVYQVRCAAEDVVTALDEGSRGDRTARSVRRADPGRQGCRWVAPSRRLVAAFVRLCCEDHR